MLKEQRKKLPKCARCYLCLHRKRINPIFFLTEVEESSRIKKDMQFGKKKIHTELEKLMIEDINMHYLKIKPQIIEKKTTRFKNKNKKKEAEKIKEF